MTTADGNVPGADRNVRGSRSSLRFAALLAVTTGILFAQVALLVDPRLIFCRQMPVFLLDWEFLRTHLAEPGGITAYLAGLVTQAHYAGWPGAAVLAALAAAIAVLMWRILNRMGGRGEILAVVPVALLTVLHNQYAHPATAPVGLLAALLATQLYLAIRPQTRALRLVLFAALSSLAWYAAPGPSLLFAAVVGLSEVPGLRRRTSAARWQDWLVGAACWAWGAALPWLAATWFFTLDLEAAYTRHLPFMEAQSLFALAASIGLYAWLPLSVVAVQVWPRHEQADATGPRAPAAGAAARKRARGRRVWRRIAWAGGALVIVAGQVVLAAGTLNPRERSLLRLDCSLGDGLWAGVLDEASRQPDLHSYAQQSVRSALYAEGRLLDDAFYYPFSRGPTPPTPELHEYVQRSRISKASRMWLEVGCVNEAEHLAYEALELCGEQPETLDLLATINVVKGQPEAARVYLRMLEKAPWHGSRARVRRLALDANPALPAWPEVEGLRQCMVKADRTGPFVTEAALLELLRANPQNRRAFEYLMHFYFLDGRPDRVVEGLGRFQAFGYKVLPRHIEEAVVQYAAMTRRPVALGPYSIRPETKARFLAYAARVMPLIKDPPAAWNAVRGEFGDTAWFVYTFGCTPSGRTGPPAAKTEAPAPAKTEAPTP